MTVVISGDTGIDTVGSNTVGNGQLIDGSVQLAKLGFTLPFTKEYVSAEQPIATAALLTLPHLLGAQPKLVQLELVCKIAEIGYSVGDVTPISYHGAHDLGSGSTSYAIGVTKDATNLLVRYGAAGAPIIASKGAGTLNLIVAANWRLIVRAWA